MTAPPVPGDGRRPRLRGPIRRHGVYPDGGRTMSRLLLAGATAAAASVGSVALVATAVWLIVTAGGRPGIAALSGAIVAVRALAVGSGLLRYVERLTGHDAVLARLTERRAAVVGGLAGRGGTLARGRWVQRLVSDVDAEGDLVVRGLLPAVAVGLTGIAALVLAASMAPGAAAALGVGFLLVALLVPVAVRCAETDAGRSDADREALSAAALDLARAGTDLAVFDGLDRARSAAGGLAARIAASDRSAARAQAALRAVGGLVVAGAVTGVVVGAAHLAPAWAAVLPVVASAVLAEAFVLLVAAPKLAAARGARRRLREVSPPDPRRPDVPAGDRSDVERCLATRHGLGSGSGAARRFRSDVERCPGPRPAIGGTSGRVPGHRSEPERSPGTTRATPGNATAVGSTSLEPVAPHLHLRDPAIDLDLPPGARVLLTGPSGSGKSTLLARLWRVRAPRGGYTIDGVDATTLDPDMVGRTVGGLWQDAHVPRSTLRDALRIARPDASDGDLLSALATVGLDADVLGNGLDDVVAENAENLSGGQRRRLLVARTLLADHPVTLFDEPVEGLAPPDADALLTTLLTLDPPGRTVVVVSHHVPDRLPDGVAHRTL